MSDGLQSPLIPLPAPSLSAKNTITETKEDPYSPLFPSSAPQGSLFGPKTTNSSQGHASARPTLAPASFESDSDFGSFVSVTPSQDPLFQEDVTPQGGNTPAVSSVASISPGINKGAAPFDDYFFEGAKIRSQENEKRVLHELLEHEDDPMYWLGTSVQHKAEENHPVIEADVISPSRQLVDLESDRVGSPALSESSTSSQIVSHHSRRHNVSTYGTSSSPPSILSRKSSLPTLSSSPPAEPIHDPMSMSMTHGAPSRTARQLLGTISSSSLNTPTLAKLFQSSTSTSSTVNKPFKHQTPFARDVFVAPSGAPGFNGDRMWNQKGFEFDEASETDGKKSVKLVGRREVTNQVLTTDLADSIRPTLPPLARLSSTWTLLYSLDQHGISLQTFYQQCSKHDGGSLLVVQDTDGVKFGAWVSEALRERSGAYYGTGDAFLWKSHPDGRQVKIFKWTGKNDYVTLSESDSVSFGGGDGHYGLYLSSSLIDGSSASCPTFDNEVLCASSNNAKVRTVEFESMGVEVWGVKLGG